MQDRFNFDGPPDKKEIQRNRILYELSDEARNGMYKTLIGQEPIGLSDEAIAEGILDPEKERERVLRENLEEDRLSRGRNRGGG